MQKSSFFYVLPRDQTCFILTPAKVKHQIGCSVQQVSCDAWRRSVYPIPLITPNKTQFIKSMGHLVTQSFILSFSPSVSLLMLDKTCLGKDSSSTPHLQFIQTHKEPAVSEAFNRKNNNNKNLASEKSPGSRNQWFVFHLLSLQDNLESIGPTRCF